jgi:hypothetical protein
VTTVIFADKARNVPERAGPDRPIQDRLMIESYARYCSSGDTLHWFLITTTNIILGFKVFQKDI